MNKFIITCGTSQLELKVIHNLSQSVEREFLDRGLEKELENKLPFTPERISVDGDNLHSKNSNDWMTSATGLFVSQFQDVQQFTPLIGTPENPLGAEITTLHQILGRETGSQWNPKDDQLVLLCSETKKGIASAIYVARLLLAIYQVPQDKIMIDMVLGLNENPLDVETTLTNFAHKLLNHMDVDLDENRCDHYSLVMSGGFKSVIPCLSFVSFLFGIELIYIFEASNQLQSLNPKINLEKDADRKFWLKVWEKFEKHGFANQTSCFRVLLSKRKNRPHLIF